MLFVVIHQTFRLCIVLRQQQAVLGIWNPSCDGPGLVQVLVEPHVLDDGLDERARVALIVDGKVVGETYVLSLGSENARENAVESSLDLMNLLPSGLFSP